MDLQMEINSLKQRITELESQVDEEQAFPKYKDFYWGVNAKGKVFCDTWEGFKFEKDMLSIGNVYQTENEAVFAVEKLKVEAELRKFSRGYIDGRNNWYILYDFERKKVMRTNELHHCHQGVIYFSDTYTTSEAIDTVGEERIKKYIFGVEE